MSHTLNNVQNGRLLGSRLKRHTSKMKAGRRVPEMRHTLNNVQNGRLLGSRLMRHTLMMKAGRRVPEMSSVKASASSASAACQSSAG